MANDCCFNCALASVNYQHTSHEAWGHSCDELDPSWKLISICFLQSLVESHDINSAWEELASLQQAGLDTALAAKSKSRKPKQAQQPSTSDGPLTVNGHFDATGNGLATASATTAAAAAAHPQSSSAASATDQGEPSRAAPTATVPAAASLASPNQAEHSDQYQATQHPTALANGHSAPTVPQPGEGLSTGSAQSQDFQENTAANSQQSGHVHQSKQQAEAFSELKEPDAATVAKQQLLMKAAPLAGMWAAERFGLADVRVLKLLEGLPGIIYIHQPGLAVQHLHMRAQARRHRSLDRMPSLHSQTCG